MKNLFFRLIQSIRFYWQAQTKFQIHSPFVFELVETVLEDRRDFYSFNDIAFIRSRLAQNDSEIELTDFGAGTGGENGEAAGIRVRHFMRRVSDVARMSACPPHQGRMIFRLVNWQKPKKMLEMGTSLGISTMYLGTAARESIFVTLEGCADCAALANYNFQSLGLKNIELITGAFEQTLMPALQKLNSVDLVFFDGNHRREPTLRYFETCLDYVKDQSILVFDDIIWSKGMLEAWETIKNHPRVTLTVDFFDIGLVFFKPEFTEKQHFRIIATKWKPFKIF